MAENNPKRKKNGSSIDDAGDGNIRVARNFMGDATSISGKNEEKNHKIHKVTFEEFFQRYLVDNESHRPGLKKPLAMDEQMKPSSRTFRQPSKSPFHFVFAQAAIFVL